MYFHADVIQTYFNFMLPHCVILLKTKALERQINFFYHFASHKNYLIPHS